jgi:hypothetical protein
MIFKGFLNQLMEYDDGHEDGWTGKGVSMIFLRVLISRDVSVIWPQLIIDHDFCYWMAMYKQACKRLINDIHHRYAFWTLIHTVANFIDSMSSLWLLRMACPQAHDKTFNSPDLTNIMNRIYL